MKNRYYLLLLTLALFTLTNSVLKAQCQTYGATQTEVDYRNHSLYFNSYGPSVDGTVKTIHLSIDKVFRANGRDYWDLNYQRTPLWYIHDSWNGIALQNNKTVYGDHSILLTSAFMEQELVVPIQEWDSDNSRTVYSDHPDYWYRVSLILAHEYGHIMEYEHGYPAHYSSKEKELLADFMAGFYLKYMRETSYSGSIGAQMNREIGDLQDLIYSLGDYDYHSDTHHGTPSERKRALKMGWDFELPSNYEFVYGVWEPNEYGFSDATKAPTKYVSSGAKWEAQVRNKSTRKVYTLGYIAYKQGIRKIDSSF